MSDPKINQDESKKENSGSKNSADSMDDLNRKIEEAKQADENQSDQAQGDYQSQDDQIQELKNALARAMADLQNFKRRSEEDRTRFVKFANIELLKTLLPIIDNFDRTSAHLPEELKANEWAKGVMQVHDDLLKSLEKMGVKRMETVGQKLDPNMHEALMSGPGEKDIVIEEFDAGYTYNEEILKPAKVKVGDGSK